MYFGCCTNMLILDVQRKELLSFWINNVMFVATEQWRELMYSISVATEKWYLH